MVSKEHVLRGTEKMNKSKVKRMVGFSFSKVHGGEGWWYLVKKVGLCKKPGSCPLAFVWVGCSARRMCIISIFSALMGSSEVQLSSCLYSGQHELFMPWTNPEQSMISAITVISLYRPAPAQHPQNLHWLQQEVTGNRRLWFPPLPVCMKQWYKAILIRRVG